MLGTLLAALIGLFGIASLLGLLDRVWWVFELADVFRLQYLVLLLAAALVAAVAGRLSLAVVAIALAAVNIAILDIPLTQSLTAVSAQPTVGELRLVVANVEVGNTDFAAVQRLVAQTRPDVFGVTELTPEMAQHLGDGLTGYRSRVVDAHDDAYGIGLYSRLPLLSAKVERFPDDGPPTIVARLQVNGETMTVVVTHVRTPFAGSVHVRHLSALADAARTKLGDRVAVCGDFNTPPWSGPLRRFAAHARLRDVYGSRAWAGYSWPTWSSLLRVPLDNCFVSRRLAVTAHRDGPDVGSDHRPLVVDIGVAK